MENLTSRSTTEHMQYMHCAVHTPVTGYTLVPLSYKELKCAKIHSNVQTDTEALFASKYGGEQGWI